MDKTTLAAIAALLLAAVLCTAGCIEAPSDPIVGDWVSETDDSVTYAVFENGGAGFFAADKDSVLTLEWKANGDTTYTLTFADGAAETAVLDAEHGLMTIGGVEYQKYPSGYSGAVGHQEPSQHQQSLQQRRGDHSSGGGGERPKPL